jgi:hypothetical protein
VGFTPNEKQALESLKGVGPAVIARLEKLGFNSLADLCGADVLDIVHRASELVGSTCWRNSPQARAAIAAVITLAEQRHTESSTKHFRPKPKATEFKNSTRS